MAKCNHCGSKLYAHLIERHHPYAISCYVPSNNPNYPEMPHGGSLTYLQEMALRPGRYWRNDIVLINLGKDRQVCLYPTKSGRPTGDAWQYMTKQEKKWAIAENKKILETLAQYPQWKVFIRD